MKQVSERPWPVVLLTALGAWFAAVPLLIAIGMLLGDMLRNGVTTYFIGVLVLGASVVVLRAQGVALFVEQLAVPGLLVGGGTLAMGLYRDFHRVGGSLILLVVVLVLALLISRTWLRVLFGAVAAGLLAYALLPGWFWERQQGRAVLILHGLLAVWLLSLWLQARVSAVAAWVEPVAAGWLLATLAGLTWMSGTTFLVGGAVGSNEIGFLLSLFADPQRHTWQAGASVLVLASAGVGALAWPTLRRFLPLSVALVLAVLAWFIPLLGAALLALMVCATTRRWRLAGACALTASWVVGAFYYQLHWPLVDKALLLVSAGIVLGALAWLDQRHHDSHDKTARPAVQLSPGGLAMLAATLLTLLVANGAIWQKQDLIAHGKPVFMALLPLDPRSLMQGDFMRLRFATLDAQQLPLIEDLRGTRPYLVVQLDARGVATLKRLHSAGQPLAVDEMLVQLTPKNGAWVVVTDAWFFKEGQAQRWQAAKFGEFRVLPDGRALLVGMADAELRAIAVDKP
jgi:uncharacterized membrane-anchored protein